MENLAAEGVNTTRKATRASIPFAQYNVELSRYAAVGYIVSINIVMDLSRQELQGKAMCSFYANTY
ncbi:MAG: hypothetical protein PF795_07240, partial [Kiritimatiellae bacterium]|nr:hypothetical protein [Kiritimatiellia bacterium]